MPLVAFNLVLTGENFPVSTVDLRDFEFQHREFRELVRLPVVLTAEAAGGVNFQLINERFEVSVVEPDDVPVQAAGLIGLVEAFQEYVGRRTIRQVGHNLTWVFPDSSGQRQMVFDSLVQTDAIVRVLEPVGDVAADLQLAFKRGDESRAGLRIGMSQPADIALEFNFHYELAELEMSALDAAHRFPASYELAVDIAGNFEALLGRNEVVGA